MRVLVAGGAGFIGSNLVDVLLAHGHTVACIDDFYLGTRENIQAFGENTSFHFYQEDICNEARLLDIMKAEQPDCVLHLAANSDIQASAQDPAVEYAHTYATTFHLLQAMRTCGVKRFFFASTSAVYGDKKGELLSETTPNLAPVSYYGAAKLGSEALISAYAYMNDMHALVFRFPNVIGPNLTHGVVHDFVQKLRKNPHELEILGDGRQTKPYLYVRDLVEAIVAYLDVPQGVTLYNIGVGTATSVTRIADIICEEMGLTDVAYRYTGGAGGWKGDVPRFQYDLRKIHATGWHAKHTSDEAVRLAARWMVNACKP
ncbi:NAD-dependent epimerase/dehydratase family protein [Selenomonas sp.]|uniref:NAD-dependent epimerase/dehydratase family protein n=1 Tax=Selenomonas sp. TaxID=2053611 RepID=UPI002A7EA99B|nr:NAD-dependent epimerase/dehydratase family protein [Selenomonas sp.]MDY4417002.1 GDP-mannose 4,6-dehydratase [Selenomonas sp.]